MTTARAPVIDVHITEDDLRQALRRDVETGLGDEPKWLSPVWFYDDRGSALFNEITRLPEYYLTRAERRLLEAHADEIAERSGADTVVELGAGTCDKSRILLDAFTRCERLERYIPLDVSDGTLAAAASALADAYPGLTVHAVVGDFHRHVGKIPEGGRRLVAFLGSTIGNLVPEERRRFLFDLDCTMGSGDTLLIGTDLVKEPERLVAAYDDSAGVTAAFNRNVLAVMNREFGAEFDPECFEHVACWDARAAHMEMRLRSTVDQVVSLPGLAMKVSFAAGEELRTEISAKFTPTQVEQELFAAGFVVQAMWEDPEGFLLTLATPYC
ncbi:MAG TPA: L-histidine N(alpha)-methyltransferase [Acidimicrobiales bacterium]|nr:L-histidine N(alpha)-methyltransferase [Acidimicrobiales bacterium]